MSTPLVIEIGGTRVALACGDPRFRRMLRRRFAGFLADAPAPAPEFHLDIEVQPPVLLAGLDPEADAEARFCGGVWEFQRGDFRARWDPARGCGRVQQAVNPYALDSVLRILHTLLLAPRGGLLLHAASAIRNGRAYVFAGVSGAGKTTMIRLAPPDVVPLSDEVSYLVPDGNGYRAWGTPFAGDWGVPGPNLSAPLARVLLLRQAEEARFEPLPAAVAARELLRSTLFFAREPASVAQVFQSVGRLQQAAPVERFHFPLTAAAWEAIP